MNPVGSNPRSAGESYRTCPECGGDCTPEATADPEHGVRVIFSCPAHGVHAIIDPLEDAR